MEQKKDKWKLILMLLILIALLILIMISLNYFGKIESKARIPTGNIDIFDIIFEDEEGNSTNANNEKSEASEQKSEEEKETKEFKIGKSRRRTTTNYQNPEKSNNSENSNNTENTTKPEDNNTDDEQFNVDVYDKDQYFGDHTPLNIFTNASYDIADDKIAPTSENSYQFVIRNRNEFGITYNLDITEENQFNVNMKFRLKLNGKYVVGDDNTYVSASELNQYNIKLADQTHDVYTLDWKWFEGENDTEVGENIEAYYKLALKITASAN